MLRSWRCPRTRVKVSQLEMVMYRTMAFHSRNRGQGSSISFRVSFPTSKCLYDDNSVSVVLRRHYGSHVAYACKFKTAVSTSSAPPSLQAIAKARGSATKLKFDTNRSLVKSNIKAGNTSSPEAQLNISTLKLVDCCHHELVQSFGTVCYAISQISLYGCFTAPW